MLLYINYYKKENFNKNKDILIVISRFNETLEWLKEEPFNKYNVLIYNKGYNDNFYKPSKLINIIKINNIGREFHTYFYHIINNYNNLNNITVFLPGSNDIEHKKIKSIKMLNKINEVNNPVIIADYYNNVQEELYDFNIDYYKCTNYSNSIVLDNHNIELSKIRPFGKWYENLFKNIIINHIAFYGIFSVSKKNILQKSKLYYKNLLNELNTSSNPETGHYFERSIEAVFYPMTDTIFIV